MEQVGWLEIFDVINIHDSFIECPSSVRRVPVECQYVRGSHSVSSSSPSGQSPQLSPHYGSTCPPGYKVYHYTTSVQQYLQVTWLCYVSILSFAISQNLRICPADFDFWQCQNLCVITCWLTDYWWRWASQTPSTPGPLHPMVALNLIKSRSTASARLSANAHWLQKHRQTNTLDWW